MQVETTPNNWELLEMRPSTAGVARIVSFANQKGGVGKTTTSINLAVALAMAGVRTLIVDLDPQANATTGLGIDHRTLATSTYDLLVDGAPLAEAITSTATTGLSIAPASPDLAGAEIELVAEPEREFKLKAALRSTTGFDVVFVDCPPSLGLLTVNALVAAHDLIVPVQCEYYALEGLGQLLGTAERVRRGLNPDLRIAGFLLTMYDARTKLASQVADEIRTHFGAFAFRTVIPRSVRLSEAPSFGESVLTLDPSSRGSISYRLLAKEFIERFGLNRSDPRASSERAAVPGPGGRGFGTASPEPPGLDEAWPPPRPWDE